MRSTVGIPLLPAQAVAEGQGGGGCQEQGKAQLEVLISRLRSKLVAQGAPTPSIRALRGQGYRLCIRLQIN